MDLFLKIALDVTRNNTKSTHWLDSAGSTVDFIGQPEIEVNEEISFAGLNGSSWASYKSGQKLDVFCVKNLSSLNHVFR